MFGIRQIRFSVLVPIALIGVSLWLLVGCLYITTPEIVYRTGSKKDFRSLVGEPGSGKPIVVGKITRSGIEALLGPPPYESTNHLRVAYTINVQKNILIFPLCFEVVSDESEAVGLDLTFDDDGMLLRWRTRQAAYQLAILDSFGPGAGFKIARINEGMLLSLLNGAVDSKAEAKPSFVEPELKPTKK